MFMGGHWWAWVRYYVHGRALVGMGAIFFFSWVGVGAILFFMGGRGCDIIVHGWAWAIAKHIE
jgi:hypothetical protein